MPAHWVLFTFWAWGHLRPESNLAVNLARKFPDITISCIVDTDFVSKCWDEMQRNAKLVHDESVLSRIRLIPLGRALAGLTPEMSSEIEKLDPRWTPATSTPDVETMHTAFQAMMEERAFVDGAGKMWAPIGKPNLILCDMMMGHVVPALKEKYGLPLYMWYGGCATPLTRDFGPSEMGGRAPTYVAECHAVEADPDKSKGRPYSEIARALWGRVPTLKDDIIRIPGLPPFYQWENMPQSVWFPFMYDAIVAGDHLIKVTDGLMLASTVDIESEGIEGVREWYCGATDRAILCLGPQMPSEYFAPGSSKATSQAAGTEVRYDYARSNSYAADSSAEVDPCVTFLDAALERYGMHSALYISFGSVHFPRKGHLEILLERILALERAMPFICTISSPLATVSEALQRKVKESRLGLMVPWAPQQAILAHPALGVMISHCGGGGTFESLSQGVPVIGWPFVADQPVHALWMSQVLDTGFELLQVRDGPVKGKAYRGGPNGTEILGTEEAIAREIDEVLAACQGEEGKRKRANAERVKQSIWDAHQPGGQIDRHLELLKRFATVSS